MGLRRRPVATDQRVQVQQRLGIGDLSGEHRLARAFIELGTGGHGFIETGVDHRHRPGLAEVIDRTGALIGPQDHLRPVDRSPFDPAALRQRESILDRSNRHVFAPEQPRHHNRRKRHDQHRGDDRRAALTLQLPTHAQSFTGKIRSRTLPSLRTTTTCRPVTMATGAGGGAAPVGAVPPDADGAPLWPPAGGAAAAVAALS